MESRSTVSMRLVAAKPLREDASLQSRALSYGLWGLHCSKESGISAVKREGGNHASDHRSL